MQWGTVESIEDLHKEDNNSRISVWLPIRTVGENNTNAKQYCKPSKIKMYWFLGNKRALTNFFLAVIVIGSKWTIAELEYYYFITQIKLSLGNSYQ